MILVEMVLPLAKEDSSKVSLNHALYYRNLSPRF